MSLNISAYLRWRVKINVYRFGPNAYVISVCNGTVFPSFYVRPESERSKNTEEKCWVQEGSAKEEY